MKRRLKLWLCRVLWRFAVGDCNRAHSELNEEAMKLAFAVSREETWFAAVRQTIRDHLADRVDMLANAELANHHGALAANAGAIDFAKELLQDLEAKRAASSGMKEHAAK